MAMNNCTIFFFFFVVVIVIVVILIVIVVVLIVIVVVVFKGRPNQYQQSPPHNHRCLQYLDSCYD